MRRVPSVLFTGFPGFLGSELLPRILGRSPNLEAACLVQPLVVGILSAFMRRARPRAASAGA